jgi:hypothetical protein
MNFSKVSFKVFFIAGAALFLFQQPLWANQRHVTCNSRDNNYNYCRVDTENQVRLSRKLSSHDCIEGETWGYDDHGVWVDRGCRADFAVGRSGYSDYNQNTSGGVPAWAVGNFKGQNERDHTPAAISISRSGDVSATWAGQQHTGYFESRNMRLGDLDFIVKQRGDGFETILRSDHGNRVFFQRVR